VRQSSRQRESCSSYGVEYDPAWRATAGIKQNKQRLGKVANDDRVDWREAWALFPGSVAYVCRPAAAPPGRVLLRPCRRIRGARARLKGWQVFVFSALGVVGLALGTILLVAVSGLTHSS
jgi:hypothetical protein